MEKTVERPGETKAKEGAVLSYVFDSIGRQRSTCLPIRSRAACWMMFAATCPVLLVHKPVGLEVVKIPLHSAVSGQTQEKRDTGSSWKRLSAG